MCYTLAMVRSVRKKWRCTYHRYSVCRRRKSWRSENKNALVWTLYVSRRLHEVCVRPRIFRAIQKNMFEFSGAVLRGFLRFANRRNRFLQMGFVNDGARTEPLEHVSQRFSAVVRAWPSAHFHGESDTPWRHVSGFREYSCSCWNFCVLRRRLKAFSHSLNGF